MYIRINSLLLCIVILAGCSSEENENSQENTEAIAVDNLPDYPVSPLPEGLVWETNNEDPVFASPEAKKGGTFNTFIPSFPLNIRSVGPDSNGAFSTHISENTFSLTAFHPNTHNPIPLLATHWSYDTDGKTVYYKLNQNAKWSDGEKVTADDYMFTLEFMRSEHIVSPWYNDHYTNEILEVKKYDDYTISVTGARALPEIDIHHYYELYPIPRHFHKLDENWVRDYDWKIEPNTGPYQITEVNNGKYVEFTLKEDWWGKDLKYFKNRFNINKIRFTVIREMETAFQHFVKGELDAFPLILPNYWHDKSNINEFEEGYIHKIWFYLDQSQPSIGLYLNLDFDMFKDINVRLGIAHSIDMEKVLSTVFRGDYLRLHNMFTGYGEYTNPNIRAREFDLEKADDYFNKAGWDERGPDGIRVKDGQRLSATITYGSSTYNDRLIVIKEEAKKAGIEFQLELLDSSTSFKKLLEKKHEMAFMGWSTGIRPQYWSQYHSDNAHIPQTNNITNTDDPKLDVLIDKYKISQNADERAELSRQIQQFLHNHAMHIPMYMVPYDRTGYWRWMKFPETPATKWSVGVFGLFGDTPNLGSAGGLIWIDEDVKQETLEAMKSGKTFEPVTIIDETYRIQ